MWSESVRDDGDQRNPQGNQRVDFVWGNVPLQPDNDRDYFLALGDGEGEYYLKGHATAQEWNNGLDADNGYYTDYMFRSMQTSGASTTAMTKIAWNSFPAYEAGTAVNYQTSEEGWNWIHSGDVRDAMISPNVLGMKLEDAQAALRSCGVANDVTREFLSTNENPYDLTGVNTETGENILQIGNVIYRYVAPDAPIPGGWYSGSGGEHWDGSPWYGREVDGLVQSTWSFPGSLVPIDATETLPTYSSDVYGKWLAHTLIVFTNDPSKDQYVWWD
jgi:hypothetical protein